MKTDVPDWLVLKSGSHPNECGVCIEECIALLIGEEKTDQPSTVNPVIRELAIAANDSAESDEARTELAQTMACQVDTANVADFVTLRLAAFVCEYSAEHLPSDVHESVPKALSAAADSLRATAQWLETPNDETKKARAAGAAGSARAADAAYNRDILYATIEEFERLTGRTECATFSDDDWNRVKEAL